MNISITIIDPIHHQTFEPFVLSLESHSTIEHICNEIERRFKISRIQQNVLFCGQVLHHDKTIEEVNLNNGAKLHVILKQNYLNQMRVTDITPNIGFSKGGQKVGNF
jgi:hypothetical protein